MTVTSDLDVLTPPDCWDLLRERCLGRLAFTERALPAIRPLNYCVVDRHVVLRVSADLADRLEGQVVAFEVDDVDAEGVSGRSVVVTGVVRRLHPGEELRTAALPPWWVGPAHHVGLLLTIGDMSGRSLGEKGRAGAIEPDEDDGRT